MTGGDLGVATFDAWAIVEIMGHRRYAGRVTEERIAGGTFIRVDVVRNDGGTFSKLFSPASVFCITPTTEEFARVVASSDDSAPLDFYSFAPEVQALVAPKKEEGPF